MEVVFGTSNPGKVREVQAILAGGDIRLVSVPMWLGDVETGETFRENALLKAAAVHRMVRRAVLAEDSGIEVDALGGLPGIHSARFAGPSATSDDNNAKLLRLLEGIEDRTARYRCVVVLLDPSGSVVTAEGEWPGRIADAPRGTAGFGYDPIFIPDGDDRTGAEMDAAEKNAVSHRARALRALLDALPS